MRRDNYDEVDHPKDRVKGNSRLLQFFMQDILIIINLINEWMQ